MNDDLSAALADYVREFESAEETTRPARILSERDNDYYHEKQLTAEEEAALRKRGQPIIVMNEIKPKVNTMLGLEKQTRKDPKAFPRNPGDEASAKAATDAIRYVCDNSRWDDKRSLAAKELAVEGTGIVKVGVTRDGKDPDIQRVAWDRFYFDPASASFDFADAKFMGEVVWMDYADAVRKWPDKREVFDTTLASEQYTETYDDKPKHGLWADYKRKRVRLCEHYCNEGGWKFSIFTKGGFVVEPQESPYLGDKGEPECPLKAVSLYLDRDNNRYGEVRTMIGAQDALNKHRSKALHSVNTRQTRVSVAAGLTPDQVRKEAARPDGVFVAERDDFEILTNNDITSGNIALMQDAQAHIQRMGVNAALGGKNDQALSGRAVLAQQQGGMVEAATYLDCIRVLSLATYRSVWARIKQLWTEERWVRITDDQRDLQFVGLNRPITALQAFAESLGVTRETLPQVQQAAQAGDEQAVAVLQQLEAAARDPRAQQVVGRENDVSEMDIDIIIDEGLDTPTIQAEQFDMLSKMLPGLFPQGAPPEAIKLLIEASSLRNKDKLLEIVEPKDAAPQPGPEEVMAMQMQAAQQQAQFEAQLEIEKAQIAAQADVEVAKIKAQTDLVIAGEKATIDAQLAEQKAETDARLAERKAMLDHQVKTVVAERTGEAQRQKDATEKEDAQVQAQTAIMSQVAQVLAEMTRPKTKIPVRDDNGFIVGVREVYEDAA
jgi:hypothetical protein